MTAQPMMILSTGKPRSGKSTAVQAIARRLGPKRCGGFYTEEVRDERDRTGFRGVTMDGEARNVASANIDGPLRIGRYGIDARRSSRWRSQPSGTPSARNASP
ncbi:NTPase [Paenibacillus sp. UNC496MF]|uniref:nucleoside-triphosphatase n=1 Tax=Paenibacillus sp. UNC496MF TaxID=1502753 RepID=UPI0008F41044|nr:nucleoside-triphosphatase [Paenibacillus sp. UNC496MF]SFJ79729.1 NTPase [Paenibacillus sp. UNC496MF]